MTKTKRAGRLGAPPNHNMHPTWCRWANPTRVPCGFAGDSSDADSGRNYPITRLAYTEVIDGTQWSLAHGYGDPKRTRIVGGSFAGRAIGALI